MGLLEVDLTTCMNPPVGQKLAAIHPADLGQRNSDSVARRPIRVSLNLVQQRFV
jgi:hypothetical protein